MKKSTGILILVSFFLLLIVMAGIFITVVVMIMQDGAPNILRTKRLALVRVEGVIYDADNWIKQIQKYQEDSTVRGIIVRVDSPGGAVGPSQELHRAILDAKNKHNKVIVVSFGSVAASGGYYIACGADKIVSTPGCMTGSIGVYAKFLMAKDLMEKVGITYETVKAGKYKDFGSMERGLSDDEREMMQGVIDDTYMQFIEAVANGRKKQLTNLALNWSEETPKSYPFNDETIKVLRDIKQELERSQLSVAEVKEATASDVLSATPVSSATEAVDQPEVKKQPKPTQLDRATLLLLAKTLSEGKVYTARQAKQIGLVDELGSLEDAILLTAKMVGISGDPTVIEQKHRQPTLLDLMTQGLTNITQNKVSSPLEYRFPY